MLKRGKSNSVGFLLGTLLLGVSATSFAQVPTNISYPISGMAYNNYITAKFDANCKGGQWTAKWGFDSTTVGGGTFYDHISIQFGHKLVTGWHVFWATTPCGSDKVQFFVN